MEYIAILTDEYLEHHGVKGMKWGVRKDRKKGSRRQKNPKKMTTQELKRRIERNELEKKYYDSVRNAKNPAKREAQDFIKEQTKSAYSTALKTVTPIVAGSVALYIMKQAGFPLFNPKKK